MSLGPRLGALENPSRGQGSGEAQQKPPLLHHLWLHLVKAPALGRVTLTCWRNSATFLGPWDPGLPRAALAGAGGDRLSVGTG